MRRNDECKRVYCEAYKQEGEQQNNAGMLILLVYFFKPLTVCQRLYFYAIIQITENGREGMKVAYPQMAGYPVYNTYPQPYNDRLAQLQNQYQQAVPTQNTQQVNQGLLWVQGENAARSYLVAPNSTVLLMDSDASRFYLKSADNAGMPNLRIFEYKEVAQNVPQSSQTAPENMDDKYVTREEYNSLRAECGRIMDRLNSFPPAVPQTNASERTGVKGNTGKSKGGNADEQSTV